MMNMEFTALINFFRIDVNVKIIILTIRMIKLYTLTNNSLELVKE